MNLTEMVSFIEEAYSVVQALRADGTYAKVLAAEQALQSELASNTSVQKLETLLESFLAKKAATTTITTVTPSA